MSSNPRTYIGPFGRILPILPGTEPLASEQQHAPIEGTLQSKMATYQLPPPVALQFGSDPFHGFGENNKRNSPEDHKISPGRQRPSYQDMSRRAYREQLPSVSQLLTPGSPASVPISPSSPQPRSEPLVSGPNQSSTHRDIFHEPSSHGGTYQQSGVYPGASVPQPFMESGLATRDSFQNLAPPPQFHAAYVNQYPLNSLPPGTHQGSYRHDPYVQQPRQLAPMTPSNQYYQPRNNSYEAPLAPSPDPGPSVRNAANTVRPLPRLVGEQLIPGEGPCWIYEDGSICKKVIDGEPVNAQWGVTKAGKPRKRLAIACTTCREKKIKCDPAEPKCVQCEKFGRICKFTTA